MCLREDTERDQSWLLELDAAQAEELQEAESLVRAIDSVLHELQQGRDVVVLRGLPVDPALPARATAMLGAIGTYLDCGLRQSPYLNLGNIRVWLPTTI